MEILDGDAHLELKNSVIFKLMKPWHPWQHKLL